MQVACSAVAGLQVFRSACCRLYVELCSEALCPSMQWTDAVQCTTVACLLVIYCVVGCDPLLFRLIMYCLCRVILCTDCSLLATFMDCFAALYYGSAGHGSAGLIFLCVSVVRMHAGYQASKLFNSAPVLACACCLMSWCCGWSVTKLAAVLAFTIASAGIFDAPAVLALISCLCWRPMRCACIFYCHQQLMAVLSHWVGVAHAGCLGLLVPMEAAGSDSMGVVVMMLTLLKHSSGWGSVTCYYWWSVSILW